VTRVAGSEILRLRLAGNYGIKARRDSRFVEEIDYEIKDRVITNYINIIFSRAVDASGLSFV
jgi:hypothetical protein